MGDVNGKRVNLYMPFDILEKVDARCEKLCISRSAYVALALSRQLESENIANNLPELLSVFNRAIDESKKLRISSKQK